MYSDFGLLSEELTNFCKTFISNSPITDLNLIEDDNFWKIARKHNLDFTILCFLDDQNLISHVPCKVYDFYEYRKSKLSLYFDEMKKLKTHLSNNNIDYIFVKGSILSKLLYDKAFWRKSSDIDLIISPKDFEKAFYLARDLGFRTISISSDKPRLRLGINFCEISMEKETDSGLRVVLEIKRGVSAIDSLDFSRWFKNKTTINIKNESFATLDISHSLLLLFSQTFINNEGKVIFYKNNLREYFEVAYWIWNKKIDWNSFVNLSNSYGLTHHVVSVLKSVYELFGFPPSEYPYLIKLISSWEFPYESTFFYYGEDKTENFNGGLLVQPIRANARYAVFDKEFATYQFIKNYKAILYSKKNKDYRQKLTLLKKEKSDKFPYLYNKSSDSHIEYEFYNDEDNLTITLKIRAEEFLPENSSVRICWYNNDITSVYLQQYVDSGLLDLVPCGKNSREIYICSRNYYEEGTQSHSMIDASVNNLIKLITEKNNLSCRLDFIIPKDIIFFSLDTIAIEVKIMENHSQGNAMSLGSTVNIISVCDIG